MTTLGNQISLKDLYEVDEDLWLEETIKLLRANCLEQLDRDNLIEELEYLGRKHKASVESLLEQIIRHLLLCQYWQAEVEYNLNHWQAEIIGFRSQIERLITANLHNHLKAQLPKIYDSAYRYVRQKTGFKVNFPEDCPYILEQLLDSQYFSD